MAVIGSNIYDNYQLVLERIDRAAHDAGRKFEDVKLVVVTKGHPASAVQQAIQAGITIFGENYAEEGLEKIQACEGGEALEWHMIGHIQSRKARIVSEHYHWVHSLDSLKLARRLDRFAGQVGRILPVLIECNVSGEVTKAGWDAWDEHRWMELLPDFAQVLALPNLSVRGLMTMPPFFDRPEIARPYFQRLCRLQGFLRQQIPQVSKNARGIDWAELSMGMSADFEIAIQEGATLVRVGTAIMGPRPGY